MSIAIIIITKKIDITPPINIKSNIPTKVSPAAIEALTSSIGSNASCNGSLIPSQTLNITKKKAASMVIPIAKWIKSIAEPFLFIYTSLGATYE